MCNLYDHKSWVVTKVYAMSEARPGWYGIFSSELVGPSKIPVEAWAYVRLTPAPVDQHGECSFDTMTGMGVWSDQPDFFANFSDFTGTYEPAIPEMWGQR